MGAISLVGICAAIALAFLPEILLGLAAFGVFALHIVGTGTRFIPDHSPGSLSTIIVILAATVGDYLLTSMLFRRSRK